MLKNIQSVTTGNTFTTSPIKETDTGITALYCRLSQDDGNVGDSDSTSIRKRYLRNMRSETVTRLTSSILTMDSAVRILSVRSSNR